jgi:hypothetical protein
VAVTNVALVRALMASFSNVGATHSTATWFGS